MSKISQLSSCFLGSIFIQMLVFTFPDTAKNENFHFFASCPKNDMQSTLKKQIQYFFETEVRVQNEPADVSRPSYSDPRPCPKQTRAPISFFGLRKNPNFELGVETLNSAASAKLFSVAVPIKGL